MSIIYLLYSPSKSLQFRRIKNEGLEVFETPPNPSPSFLKKLPNKIIELLSFFFLRKNKNISKGKKIDEKLFVPLTYLSLSIWTEAEHMQINMLLSCNRPFIQTSQHGLFGRFKRTIFLLHTHNQ